jgi:hypothetical protein
MLRVGDPSCSMSVETISGWETSVATKISSTVGKSGSRSSSEKSFYGAKCHLNCFLGNSRPVSATELHVAKNLTNKPSTGHVRPLTLGCQICWCGLLCSATTVRILSLKLDWPSSLSTHVKTVNLTPVLLGQKEYFHPAHLSKNMFINIFIFSFSLKLKNTLHHHTYN